MFSRLGPHVQCTSRVWPGGTSMKPFATTSKIGLSSRFTSFALRVTKMIFARALCGTLSPLIQCEFSTRPMTFLSEVSGLSSSAVPAGVSQRVSGPATWPRSADRRLAAGEVQQAVSSNTDSLDAATDSSLPVVGIDDEMVGREGNGVVRRGSAMRTSPMSTAFFAGSGT